MTRLEVSPAGEAESSEARTRRARSPRAVALLLLLLPCVAGAACEVDEKRSGVPSEAQAAIDRLTDDADAGRYDKIYDEAAEEWRRAATPEESREALERVRTRLGKVGGRTFYSGREQRNASGDIPGDSLIISYQTTFERGSGMETFTLVKRDGRWLLARYFVSSDALQ